MIFKVIVATLLATIILFAWGIFSWMILPWHANTLQHFNNNQEMVAVLEKNALQSGIYVIPSFNRQTIPEISLPNPNFMAFAVVSLKGISNMKQAMLIGFLTQLIAAFLVTLLVTAANLKNYISRLGLVLLFAIAAGVVSEIPRWNWWRFPAHFILIDFADLVISWFLAGIVIAAVVRENRLV